MMEVITRTGKKYAVSSAAGCTVTTDTGLPLLTVKAGIQEEFWAASERTLVSDDSATVIEVDSASELGRPNVTLQDMVQEAISKQSTGYYVGAYTYAGVPVYEWRAPVTALTYGYKTFFESNIIRFWPEGGLPNLSRAPYMLAGSVGLSHFRAEMPNIVCMDYMFASTTLRIFECSALPILNSAVGAFNGTFLPASEIVKILDMLPNYLSQEMWPLPIDPATGKIIPLDETSEEYANYLALAKSVKHYIDFEDCLGVPDVPAEAWAAAEAKGWTINRSSSTRFDSVLQLLKN